MVSYRRLACVTDKQIANIIAKVGSLDAVEGFDGLEEEDQAAVLAKALGGPAKGTSASSSSKPARKAAAKPKAKAARVPKAAPKRKALPPIEKQHAFLDKAKAYDFEAVKAMIEEEPDLVSVQPAGRWSALHQFAEKGDADAIRFLLSSGADRDAKTKDGKTPLDVAAAGVADIFDEEMEAEEEAEEEEEQEEEEAVPEPEEKKGAKRKAPEPPASPAKKVAKRTPSAAASPAKKAKAGERPVDAAVPGRDNYSVVDDWSVLLNQTNVGANNNKYYRIQVLKHNDGKYYCWTHWGRVGSSGDHKLDMSGSQEAAEKEFKAKFKQKSGVAFDNKDSHDWKPTIGKYTLVETEEQDGGGGDSAPLGKLTEQQIEKGQAVLERLQAALEKKGAKGLEELSSEFYTLIPHDFGFKAPPVINTKEMLEAEEELLKFYLRMGFEDLEKQDDSLSPVSGIMELALPPSLETACSKVCKAHDIKASMERGKKHAAKQAGCPTAHIEAHLYAAIMLYTSNAIYRDLNAVLRSEDRSKIKKYFQYLRLLLEALGRLPQKKRTLWRGIGVDLYDKYKEGSTITWWGVSSCTSDMQVAKNFMNGCGGKCTLLTIKTKTAADISDITFFGHEKESLLAPGTQLKVMSSVRKGKVTEITLEEVGRVLD